MSVKFIALRSIPALAGQPRCWCGIPERCRVYPRAGGATSVGLVIVSSSGGLSPRWRGNQELVCFDTLSTRSIPALAGQPRLGVVKRETNRVYPRAGGATLRVPGYVLAVVGLSPRWRGNPRLTTPSRKSFRSIPALAGQPSEYRGGTATFEVYPRAGGATRDEAPQDDRIEGLSPRWRGNRVTQW